MERVEGDPGLEPGWESDAQIVVDGDEGILIVDDHRISVRGPSRAMLDIDIDGVRRVQFDIERGVPATMVIVPSAATQLPQVLSIPREQHLPAVQAMYRIGRAMQRRGRS
jgi:hypothetical protein